MDLNQFSNIKPSGEAVYYTGAQAQVLIGGTFVLQAIDLTWNRSDDHVPYWGYRSRTYDYVFKGRTMIAGQLVMNLLDNRLLDVVCNRYAENKEKDSADTIAGEIAREGAGAVDHLDQIVAHPANSQDLPGFLGMVQKAVVNARKISREIFPVQQEGPQIGMPPDRLALETLRWFRDQQRFGIDIATNIGDPSELGKPWVERNASVYEVLKGVIFTGENRSIRISPEIIAQAYTFFARDVVTSPDQPGW